jgi:hypothetical protein
MRTNAGADWQSGVMADTASNGTGAYAAANYIALTADTGTPVDTDTTLPGEIETGDSGTLSRVQATYAHTTGTSTYTLTNLFTSDESVTVAKIGVLNDPTVGTLVFEDLFGVPAVLYSGDQLLVVESVNF